MAQFDLHRRQAALGYLLDVQSDFLQQMETRIVVPLLPPMIAPIPARYLNPVFRIADADFVMVTQYIAAVPLIELGPCVGRLEDMRDDITRALDRALHDF